MRETEVFIWGRRELERERERGREREGGRERGGERERAAALAPVHVHEMPSKGYPGVRFVIPRYDLGAILCVLLPKPDKIFWCC